MTSAILGWLYWKYVLTKRINVCLFEKKKYFGSLNDPLRANPDYREQIFARDCNNSGETEEVSNLALLNGSTRV